MAQAMEGLALGQGPCRLGRVLWPVRAYWCASRVGGHVVAARGGEEVASVQEGLTWSYFPFQ